MIEISTTRDAWFCDLRLSRDPSLVIIARTHHLPGSEVGQCIEAVRTIWGSDRFVVEWASAEA